jgi:surface antigen
MEFAALELIIKRERGRIMLNSTVVKRTCRGILLAPLVVSMLLLSGCFENKAQSGAGLGAMGGGLVGSLLGPSKNRGQNALIGALIGGAIGYAAGNEMDKNDKVRVNSALENNQSYKTSEWVNPDTGNAFSVTPQSVQQVNGKNCREVEIKSVVNGKEETVIQTACRGSDGQWAI